MMKTTTTDLKRLRTHKGVIDALGGARVVARRLGVSINAVYNWGKRGAFPAHTYVIMQELLADRGCTAPPELWAMSRVAR